jgi:hypothetical protein
VLAGGGGQLLAGRAGDWFRQVEQGVVFALAEILRLEQFGQADHLGTASRGVGHAFESLVKILLGLRAAGHLHQSHTEFVRGHVRLSRSI